MGFDYEGILIPNEVEPANEDNMAWGVPLFKKIADSTDSPSHLWQIVFNTLFLDERFTVNHKYSICIMFTAQIVKMYMEMQYGEVLSAYDATLELMKEEPMIETPKLIY